MITKPFLTNRDLDKLKIEILKSYDSQPLVILSIDCDGIDLGDLFAVSAPNHQGTPFNLVLELLKFLTFEKNICQHMGIYELNPIFDHTNNLSARKAAWLAYNFILGPEGSKSS